MNKNNNLINIKEKFTQRLFDIRLDENLKQSEIAAKLETTQSNYSRWESGKKLMPLSKLNLLCNTFNLSMDYVIGISKNKNGNGIHNLDLKVIGNNIKNLRTKYDITQNDLAKILNTTQSTISAYESGDTLILISYALKIVSTYNESLDNLCGRNNTDNKKLFINY